MDCYIARLDRIIATNARCEIAHVLGKFILNDLRINLRGANISVTEHLGYRLNRYTV